MINMNNEEIVMTVIVIAVAVAILVLKLFHLRYCRNANAKNSDADVFFTSMPSYEDYERISQKASPKNKPQRKAGDFFDFIFASDEDIGDCIENRLLVIYGEDLEEEKQDEH